jgi:CheY-like chemotaxis protein
MTRAGLPLWGTEAGGPFLTSLTIRPSGMRGGCGWFAGQPAAGVGDVVGYRPGHQERSRRAFLARRTMSKRILVVEDNPDNRILIIDVLSSLDYEVLVALDGEEGVQIAEKEVPDLILMDLSLPKVDGWVATKRIKAQEALAKIPVIALTAHAMVGDREQALQVGCDDYISKPIDLRELSSKLEHFLG